MALSIGFLETLELVPQFGSPLESLFRDRGGKIGLQGVDAALPTAAREGALRHPAHVFGAASGLLDLVDEPDQNGPENLVVLGTTQAVLLLEIGPKWDRNTIFHTEHSYPYDMPFRGLGRPGQYDGLWKVSAYTEHLYVHPYKDRYATAPGTDFHWTRIHAVGGRTNTWARVSLRMSEWDMKPKSLQDGAGEDWPISYDELAPYYDKAEDLMGVFGTREGLAVTPDGNYHAPTPAPRCGEAQLVRGGKKIGIPIIPIRKAIILKNRDNRAACHYCGNCDYGCSTASRFSTLDTIIPQLVGKKNFTLRTGAAVHRVLLDPKTGKARGVEFIDTKNRLTYEARAKVVVIGAGAMASTRILLNSKTRHHEKGLANASGVLGHYIMDNFKAGMISGYIPAMKGSEVMNDDGSGGGHVYVPRHTNIPGGRKISA